MSKPVQVTGDLLHVSRAGVKQCMANFGQVIHVHKPPACGDPIEDAAIVRFANDQQAELCVKCLQEGRVYIDGVCVSGGWAPNKDPKALGKTTEHMLADASAPAPQGGEGQLALPAQGMNATVAVRNARVEPRKHARFDQSEMSLRDLALGHKRSRSRGEDRLVSRHKRRDPSRPRDDYQEGDRGRRPPRDREGTGGGEREWICQLTTPRPSMRDLLFEEPRRSSQRSDRRREDRGDGRRDRHRRHRDCDYDERDEEYEDRCEDDGYDRCEDDGYAMPHEDDRKRSRQRRQY